MNRTEFITDRETYRRVILGIIPEATRFLWLATSGLKDLYLIEGRRRARPFLALLSDLVGRGVAIRLLHAGEPGPAFRKDFDRYPNLIDGLERVLCPRVHFKSVIVDGRVAYSGSANLTGAGLGAKSDRRRNFEAGILTTDPDLATRIMAQFDGVWMGKHCAACGRKAHCIPLKD
ncbi:MAG: phospholipase D family protein [Kiritimatiellae bacterium]|nr:phospholipase D family protein [Kiritimatiellia bacterium]